MTSYAIPGLSEQDCQTLATLLQERLSAYNDLHLTLKHVHWNVVGPNFIGVHEMIDPQVELAAVRIAQEGVTNALRHAEARRAVVRVAEEAGELVVAVDDDGPSGKAPALSVSGHGLRGMAERAAACGGRLDIARSDLGGWSVRATLPCHQNDRP